MLDFDIVDGVDLGSGRQGGSSAAVGEMNQRAHEI